MHLIGKVRLFIDLYSSGKSCLECYQIAGLAAELYPDQMNRLIQVAVFVRISLCLQLRHCRPFRCQFHNLELEQIHSVVETNRHVQTPIAATVFHNDVESHRCEVGVEHAGVIAFVVRYVIVCVPLIGDAGKEWSYPVSTDRFRYSSRYFYTTSCCPSTGTKLISPL